MTTFTSSPVQELVQLRIRDGVRMLSVAATTAAAAATELGFGPRDVGRVRSVVALLCDDVVKNHFDDPADADFLLTLGDRHGSLVIQVQDKGLPFPVDQFTLHDESLVGKQYLHGEAESIRFENLGVDGNLLELTISRDPRYQDGLGDDADVNTTPVEHDAPITIRALHPEDAPGLARCVYRCYGYTYASDFLYYPDQILSMIERKLLRSFVGVNPEGEVVGHSGLLREHTESPVAESGMGVVDPRYRHHHLLESLKTHQSEAVEELDLVGIYVDAVTVHPITQKVNAGLGAHETGILLAQIPAFTHFRGFEEKEGERGSVVVYYRSVGDTPHRTVFFPARYQVLLESIYAPLTLNRTVHNPAEQGDAVIAKSSVHVEVKARRGLARIEVVCGGADLVSTVESLLRELCHKRFDVIHLDLSLSDSAAMAAVENLVQLGFFFAAVIPELRAGMFCASVQSEQCGD